MCIKQLFSLCDFRFGGKEEFMTFMNRFIEKEAVNMKNFLRNISVSMGKRLQFFLLLVLLRVFKSLQSHLCGIIVGMNFHKKARTVMGYRRNEGGVEGHFHFLLILGGCLNAKT